MKLFVDGKRRSLRHDGDVSSLLKKLGMRREEVVVKVNGGLVPDTSAIAQSDKVEVIKVVFGG